MNACILELNDAGLAATANGDSRLLSPGYALLDNAETIVGESAQAVARIHPRQVNNRFWQQLGLNPLAEKSHLVRHHADLAYRHLLHIHALAGQPERVIFAVPASFDRDQLAVLLGITQQCPFDAVGLVDLAVAAAAGVDLPGPGVHVDLQLHQAVISAFDIDAGNVFRTEVRVVEGAGRLALYSQLAHSIADAFIQQCRFDPMHEARTEQLLYDSLAGWLHQEQQVQEFVFEIPHGDSVHAARLPRASFLRPVQQLGERLQARIAELNAADQCTLVGENLLDLPGFVELLGNGIAISPGVVASACRRYEALISSEATSLPFITSLPASMAPQPLAAPRNRNRPQLHAAATHIVVAGTAYALDHNALYLQAGENGRLTLVASRNEQVQASVWKDRQQVWLALEPGATVLVNDVAAQRQQALAKGDCLSLVPGGPQALLIEVSTARGAQT